MNLGLQCYIFAHQYTNKFGKLIQSHIKNLIFDLGGVIIGLDTSQTVKAMAEIGGISHEKARALFLHHPVFLAYEQGFIPCDQFREQLRTLLGCSEGFDIDIAWNSMLLEISVEKLALLEKLRKSYKLYLLSNTNQIHLDAVNNILQKVSSASDFSAYFDRAYYSHQMGLRKPDKAIYEQVLEENGLVAEETLFIDDNLSNIEGASTLNIQTLHVTSQQTLFDFFQFNA